MHGRVKGEVRWTWEGEGEEWRSRWHTLSLLASLSVSLRRWSAADALALARLRSSLRPCADRWEHVTVT